MIQGNSSEYSSSSSDIIKIVEVVKDGKPIKIQIKLIPEDRYEEAADHISTHFTADEPLCKCENLKDDPVAVQDFRNVFRHVLNYNLSVGAFVENPEDGKSILAGLSVLYVNGKEKKPELIEITSNLKSDKARKVLHIMDNLSEVGTEITYGSEKYLAGYGLCVDPLFRGNAIGYHLLLARNEIGRKIGISTTVTLFTSIASIKLATRAGFEVLTEKLRDEIIDENGKLLVPTCETECFKIMGKRLN